MSSFFYSKFFNINFFYNNLNRNIHLLTDKRIENKKSERMNEIQYLNVDGKNNIFFLHTNNL